MNFHAFKITYTNIWLICEKKEVVTVIEAGDSRTTIHCQ